MIIQTIKNIFFSTLRSNRVGLFVLSILIQARLKRLLTRSVKSEIEYRFSKTEIIFDELHESKIKRIIAFWQVMKSMESESRESFSEVSLWDAITENQQDFRQIMDEGDPKNVFDYLSSSPTKSLATGILEGDHETMMLKLNPLYRNVKAKLTLLRFLNLVESVGVGVKTQNPEQGAWGVDKNFCFSQAWGAVEAQSGTAIVPTQECFTGLFQVRIGDRYFNQVDLMSIYASMKIRDGVKGLTRKSVIEIGAGFGSTALWCHKLGIGPIYLVDLPHAAILQAYYLLMSLPESNIWLYGEEIPLSEAQISIYPHFAKDEIQEKDISLVFNQDSFAEMHTATVKEYLRFTVRVGAAKLLSINHESEAVVDGKSQVNLTKVIALNSDFHLRSRTPNWMRPGYIETIWRIKSR